MESSAATHPDGLEAIATLDVAADPRPSRRRDGGPLARSVVLARGLASADMISSMSASALVALATGMPVFEAFTFTLASGLIFPMLMFSLGVYAVDNLRDWASGLAEAPKALVGAVAFSWPLLGVAHLLAAPAPALTAGAATILTLLLSTAARGAARAALHRADPLRQRTLVVGSGRVAGQLVSKLQTHKQFGLIPVGFVDDDSHAPGTPDLRRLGTLGDLPAILAEGQIDRVVIAFSRASHQELLNCIRSCRDNGVAVDIIPRLFEFLVGARSLDTVGGLPLLSLGTHRLTKPSKFAKRALDLVGSSLLLALLSPLLLLMAIAIRLESKGPVLFRQPRVGRGGREFNVFKFRSMYSDAPLQLNVAGVMVKAPQDARVTRVGRRLRRFSLDELPQLLNVLRGEMSMVGPRPLILAESATLDEAWHVRRFDLRPGLTGIWQIQGRSENPFEEMIRLDYEYVAGWSLARDIEILLATVPAVLSGRGAY